MNWDALGAIAELLGAVAVFFTLAYLALQVRQNANALRHQNEFSAAQIMQARTDTLINVSAAMLSNEQNLQIISNIGPELASRRDIDPADQQRANQVLNVFRSMFENIYEQHQRGFVSQEFYQGTTVRGLEYFGSALLAFRTPMSPDFKVEVQRIVENSQKPSAHP